MRLGLRGDRELKLVVVALKNDNGDETRTIENVPSLISVQTVVATNLENLFLLNIYGKDGYGYDCYFFDHFFCFAAFKDYWCRIRNLKNINTLPMSRT